MKPAPFDYARPADLDEAIGLLDGRGGMAKVLAGGQSLVPMLNLRLAPAELLVDISRLPELAGAEGRDGVVVLGACVTHAAIEDGAVPDPARGLLKTVAGGIAYRAIRNRGTIGGSMALADPSAEWPAVLMALDATLEIRGPGGARRLGAGDFVQGAYTTALGEAEILERISIPRLDASARWGFHKTCRKSGEFATSLAVIVVDPERSVSRAVLGATAGAPLSLARTAARLAEGGPWSEAREKALKEAMQADLAEAGRAFDDFEERVHGATILRAARAALAS